MSFKGGWRPPTALATLNKLIGASPGVAPPNGASYALLERGGFAP
jgi:hypothetical protein